MSLMCVYLCITNQQASYSEMNQITFHEMECTIMQNEWELWFILTIKNVYYITICLINKSVAYL